jgi:radical SAM protein with 4Fe4S-binding SPASM domain
MSEIDQALEQLNKEYCVIDTFYYSTLANNNNGEKILYDWLRRHYKDYFEPNERLVFLQDCADVYEYNDELGNYTNTIKKALKVVDITNCFVTILTTNKNIARELAVASDTDVIHHIIVPGEYHPIFPTFGDTFCPLPWMHLHINPAGDVLPCCAGDTSYPLGNIDQDSLVDIYNNKKFQKLRQGLLTGKHPKECQHCWIKEKTGIKSHRLNHNENYQISKPRNDGLVDQFDPTTLDIRINKVCNLKCRSCSPHLSSAIAQEVQGIYNVDWPTLNNRQRKSVMSELLLLLPNSQHIYFAGGEPLLAPEHLAMITELVQIKNTDLNIFYNTNFMQLDFRGNSFTDIWKEFSDITIGASLDAYGSVAEYLRHGTVWSTVESNLKRLQNEASHVKFKVTSTVGFLNVESLIELQRNWTERELISIDQFSISQIIFDSFFSVQAAPMHHKKRLTLIIENHIGWLDFQGAQELSMRWQQVIDYMWLEDRTHLLDEFQRTMRNQDSYRNESFHQVLPQFADLIPLVE